MCGPRTAAAGLRFDVLYSGFVLTPPPPAPRPPPPSLPGQVMAEAADSGVSAILHYCQGGRVLQTVTEFMTKDKNPKIRQQGAAYLVKVRQQAAGSLWPGRADRHFLHLLAVLQPCPPHSVHRSMPFCASMSLGPPVAATDGTKGTACQAQANTTRCQGGPGGSRQPWSPPPCLPARRSSSGGTRPCGRGSWMWWRPPLSLGRRTRLQSRVRPRARPLRNTWRRCRTGRRPF